jgi:hypothetical protein
MAEVRVYTRQPGGPQQTVLVAFYERYRKEKGSKEFPELEAILFGDYLLTHLEEFQTELKDYKAIHWPEPPNNAGI